jgi:hypothetical protein
VPQQPFHDELANHRKPRAYASICLPFSPSLLSVLSARFPLSVCPCSLWRLLPPPPLSLFLLRFLRSNDERERQINYRALTFAFTGTLFFSAAIGFFQRFGFHPVSWLSIPELMTILWSIGLILYSWRYR